MTQARTHDTPGGYMRFRCFLAFLLGWNHHYTLVGSGTHSRLECRYERKCAWLLGGLGKLVSNGCKFFSSDLRSLTRNEEQWPGEHGLLGWLESGIFYGCICICNFNFILNRHKWMELPHNLPRDNGRAVRFYGTFQQVPHWLRYLFIFRVYKNTPQSVNFSGRRG